MKLSIVVPLFNHAENIYSFIDEVEARAQSVADVCEIIITTNQEFEFVENIHERLKDKVHIVAVRESDDYQQVVMAGVDRADGDATIIMTPEYDPALIDDMVAEWRDGKEVVCLRRKHGKFLQFITKVRLKIYNFFLFMFGDIFSIGILKDAQLLDKKIVDKMKTEQDFAHRMRTMYAPLDYNTSVFNIEHPIERFETKGTPKFDFWLGAIGAVITILAMITAFALAGTLGAPIWFWTTIIIFGLIFEFVFIALLVNATARVKIGILHNVDEQGRIYNAVQEYHKEEQIVASQIIVVKNEKIATTRKTNTKKAVEKSTPKMTTESSKVKKGEIQENKQTTTAKTKVGKEAVNTSPKKSTARKTSSKASTKVDVIEKESEKVVVKVSSAKTIAKKPTKEKESAINGKAKEPKGNAKKRTTVAKTASTNSDKPKEISKKSSSKTPTDKKTTTNTKNNKISK